MHIIKLVGWALVPVVIVVGTAAATAQKQPVERMPAPTLMQPPPEESTVEPVMDVRTDDAVMHLAEWTSARMQEWPKAQVPMVDLDGLGLDIATAAIEDDHPGDAAMLLAAIGYFEGARFAQYVDDFSCNDWMAEARMHPRVVLGDAISVITGKPIERRVADKAVLPKEAQHLLAFGDCDGGHAYSLWQIHPGDYGTTPEALRDRVVAAKLALSIARRDLSRYTTGDAARALASATLRKHPWELPRE